MEVGVICKRLGSAITGSLLVFIFFNSPLYAGTCDSSTCSGSSPWTAASASYNDVNHCVNSCAGRGDIVNVPAGNVTWGSMLNVTKGVSIRGAGTGATTINGTSSSSIIQYNPDSTARSNDEPFEVSGFTFNCNHTGNYVIWVKNLTTTPIRKVKIHDNKFINASNGIVVSGQVYGVAYKNQFDRAHVAFRALGSDQTAWANFSPEYGSPNNFYFEDNSIYFSSPLSGYTGWIESGQGGRDVIRYNSWSGTTDEIWDVHGLQTPRSSSAPQAPDCEQYSTMVAEFYGNRVEKALQKRWMNHRGSWLMMFNNSWTSSSGGNPTIQINEYSCDSCAKYGYGEGQHVNNTYVWSNIANGTMLPIYVSMDVCGAAGIYAITENRDFFNYTSGFNGTRGVGCGPLSQRPATCTTGVAYWATNQSCTDISSTTGVSPSTTISGTLYKCTSTNNWTAYYTPYTYPHPLRTGDSGGSSGVVLDRPPEPPINLRVIQ